MRKVLFVTTVGGFVPQFELNDVKILQDMGYEVHYCANFKRMVYDVDTAVFKNYNIKTHQIDIHSSPRQIGANIKAFRQLRKLLHQEKYDLIHCHTPMGSVLARMAAAGKKCKVIYSCHGFHFGKGMPLINWVFLIPERLLARVTDCIVTINKEDYSRAKRFHLRKGGFVAIVPSVGLDTDKFYPDEAAGQEYRKEHNISPHTFHIVSVGELNDNKNHISVINALSELKEYDFLYTICGDGTNRQYLTNAIQDLGLENKVKLAGYERNVSRVLQSADCFVFPSIREGLGMAAIEALACGIPVVAGDCRGSREYILPGKNGYMCAPRDVKGYSRIIKYLMDNPGKVKALSKNCRASVLKFDKMKTSVIMREVYEKIDSSIDKGI